MAEKFRIVKGHVSNVKHVQIKADTAVQCEIENEVVTIMTPVPPVVNEGDFISVCIVRARGLELGLSYKNLSKNTGFISPTGGMLGLGFVFVIAGVLMSWLIFPLIFVYKGFQVISLAKSLSKGQKVLESLKTSEMKVAA